MTRVLLVGLLLALLAPGCHKDQVSGPPTLHLGRDECAHCGMIINEERFSCAIRAADAPLVFDDIGCMLDYRAEHADLKLVDDFVHDYSTQQWLGAGHAAYVIASSGTVATPMGSGIVAFSTTEAANAQARTWNASPMEYSSLPAARHAWKEARK